MTDTQQVDIDPAAIVQAQAELDGMIAVLANLLSNASGVPAGVTVRLDPADGVFRMLADGSIEASNDIVIELNGQQARITQAEMASVQVSGGDAMALIRARLDTIGAGPLSDAQLIRALLAKLGGEATFTAEDMAAARKPSTLQYDGATIKLITA